MKSYFLKIIIDPNTLKKNWALLGNNNCRFCYYLFLMNNIIVMFFYIET